MVHREKCIHHVKCQKAKIFIMDDDKMIRRVASFMLTGLGLSAITCSTGEEAVDFYRKEKVSN